MIKKASHATVPLKAVPNEKKWFQTVLFSSDGILYSTETYFRSVLLNKLVISAVKKGSSATHVPRGGNATSSPGPLHLGQVYIAHPASECVPPPIGSQGEPHWGHPLPTKRQTLYYSMCTIGNPSTDVGGEYIRSMELY
jgi:hypothetical protein